MKNLFIRKAFLLVFILISAIGSSDAQILKKNASRRVEKELFGKSLGKKSKVKEPKAKKKQDAKDRKRKDEYAQSVKKSQKRTIDIQTPEVRKRMKQNHKDNGTRDKTKKRKEKTSTRKAGRKYN